MTVLLCEMTENQVKSQRDGWRSPPLMGQQLLGAVITFIRRLHSALIKAPARQPARAVLSGSGGSSVRRKYTENQALTFELQLQAEVAHDAPPADSTAAESPVGREEVGEEVLPDKSGRL